MSPTGGSGHVARQLDDDEQAEHWPRLVDAYMHFDSYRRRTDRDIPLVMLSAAGDRRPVRDDPGLTGSFGGAPDEGVSDGSSTWPWRRRTMRP